MTAILVLFGLPWLLTGSILAHEVMHAWLRTNGYRNLPPEVEEGLCQLMALLWLEGLPGEAEVSLCLLYIRLNMGLRWRLDCLLLCSV